MPEKFGSISENSMDAVSDRDFLVDFTAASTLLMLHLSRFAEDLILFSSSEFGFLELTDRVSTGSSLLPQKRNPDSAELIRGKTARVIGNHTALLALLKGLPLTYNKDLQEDKGPFFDTVEIVSDSLTLATLLAANLRVDRKRLRLAADIMLSGRLGNLGRPVIVSAS